MTDSVEHFCTLFDLGFLPQGLVLHASLRRHMPDSLLWILCMDSDAREALARLDLPGTRLLTLADVETEALLAVKPGRSRGEYCWTLTSSLMCHILETHPDVARLTYLDADIWFRDSPQRILSTMDASNAHVLLTPHDYDQEHDQSVQSGRYCVQFVPVRNTPEGLAVLHWWRDRCIEWCFARQEPGLFGDQKYLDEWIPRFGKDVEEIPDSSMTLAPWNARKHAGDADRAIFFHFHNLRIHEGWQACLWRLYRIPKAIEKAFYTPYLDDLGRARIQILSAGLRPRLLPPRSSRIMDSWRRIRRHFEGIERWRMVP